MVPKSEAGFPTWEAADTLREGKFPRRERADHDGEKVFPGGEGVGYGFWAGGSQASRLRSGQTRPNQTDQASSPGQTRPRSSARTPRSFWVRAGV